MSNLIFRSPLEQISPYVPGKPVDDVKRELGLDKVIKLASNENPYGCSPNVKDAIAHALETSSLYPDGNCTLLRNKLAKKHSVKASQFVFGAGSNEIISFIAQIFIDAGDESIMPNPSFLWYEIAVRTMGGTVVEVPLKNHVHDLDKMAAKITDRTKIIWLCNPNNPTGTIFTEQELTKFLDSVPSNILVVLDEAYFEYAQSDLFQPSDRCPTGCVDATCSQSAKETGYPNSVPLLNKYPNIVILRTFSKAFGLASLRVGYAICSEEIAGYLNRVRPPFNVNSMAQVAACASLDDINFSKECATLNRQGMEYLYSEFSAMNLSYIESYTNFVMVNVKQSGLDVFNKLLKKGVIVRFDPGFGMPEWIRVTVGTMDENRIFIEALKAVLN